METTKFNQISYEFQSILKPKLMKTINDEVIIDNFKSDSNNYKINENKINSLYKTLSLSNLSIKSKSKKLIENKENLIINNNICPNTNNKNQANFSSFYDDVSKNSKNKFSIKLIINFL